MDDIERAMLMAEGVWRRINNREERNTIEQDRKDIAGCPRWQREIQLIADGIYAAVIEEREIGPK